MTGKKRSLGSRSRSRSVSPGTTRHRKSSKGSSEQNKLSKRVKHKQSSSSDIPTSGRSNACSKSKKISKSRNSSQSSDTSADSQSDSSCSSKNSSLAKAKERKKLRKLEKKKRRKEKKLKKKHKKEKRRHKEATEAVTMNKERTLNVKPEVPRDDEPGEPTDQLLMDRAKAMAPMTKEEWEKRQSVIRRVYDEETGRHRWVLVYVLRKYTQSLIRPTPWCRVLEKLIVV
jgi:hypothetical protein